MGRVAKLMMVTDQNNNKFYDMVENADGSITATWGRVDVTSTVTHYPVGKKKWETLYNSKVKKGYKDITHLKAEESGPSTIIDVPDRLVRSLVDSLLRFANKAVQANYTISAAAVTEAQIKEAQAVIDALAQAKNGEYTAKNLNKLLLELYTVLPRKMKKVQHHLLDEHFSADDFKIMIGEEQSLLDVMAGQVKTGQSYTNTSNKGKTILEAAGISIIPASADTIKYLKDKLGSESRRFKQAYEVVNSATQAHFDTFLKKASNDHCRHFWHGSRNENWWSILGSGLVLRPTNAVITGKMFGYGLYFADKALKSLGYTSLRGSYWARGSASTGFMALYKVHLGNFLKIKHHQSWCSGLTFDKLRGRGAYDSLFAEGGADLRNNEYIIYKQEQCTVRYLVELGG